MRDEFIRFRNYKNRVALRFRVRCVSAFTLLKFRASSPNFYFDHNGILMVFTCNIVCNDVVCRSLARFFKKRSGSDASGSLHCSCKNLKDFDL